MKRSPFLAATALAVIAFATACDESGNGARPPGGSGGGTAEPSNGTGGMGGNGGASGAGGPGFAGSGGTGDNGPSGTGGAPVAPGQTDFTSQDPANSGTPVAGVPATGGTDAPNGPARDAATGTPAPAGRVADVEEGDIYKVVGTRLYYLNTYKGLTVYDVTNPKAPARLSRLPVFGYPIEMYVEGNTIHALLKDALYLTEVGGKLQFARHYVSQLVTIDIADPAKPRIIKTIDITGQLREGVSRKVENTIYVVSYLSRSYYRGWAYEASDPNRQDQAWVYSFDVADPANPKKVGELKVFEGGAVNFTDTATGTSFSRSFSGVWISATANALMVVENWYISAAAGVRSTTGGCGYYNSDQQAVVSLVDISDPKGSIRVHARFETAGSLTDQFKQTYVHNPTTGKSTYFGIFARRGWQSTGCTGTTVIQNTIEAWDVTDGARPARVGRLDFGKPNETVRGTAFDVSRNVAYAITARQIDPLYAIDIADPKNLRVLSAIDGLSGDVSVFRLVGDKKFLLAVGRDNSATCTGFEENAAGAANIAVSIIDATDLTKLRLVQRKCIDVKNAGWVNSQVTWNLDQAHKMLGMHADGDLNVLTVPVSYWKRSEDKNWWWDRYETAVGIMSWDLGRYDSSASHLEQTVIQSHGTFIHPNGEVRRSILFKHPTLAQRLMANLSDTHISIANIQDLAKPSLESIVEVAPYLAEIFRFGDYLVEQAQLRSGSWWEPSRGAVEFRVKRAGGDIEEKAPVATFVVGQAQRVVKHGDQLVVFRYVPARAAATAADGTPVAAVPAVSEAVVYDLANPSAPRLAARVPVPNDAFPYYFAYCGGYFDTFWIDRLFYGGTSWVDTTFGLVIGRPVYKGTAPTSVKLLFLDLRDPNAPVVTDKEIMLPASSTFAGLTIDSSDPRSFYLAYRTSLGQATRPNGTVFTSYKDYVERLELGAAGWVQQPAINVPGRLLRIWRNTANERRLLTSDTVWTLMTDVTTGRIFNASFLRLNLLRETGTTGATVAELLDARTFENLTLNSLVLDGERLFASGRGVSYATTAGMMVDYSDRLFGIDLSGGKVAVTYDQSMKTYNARLMGVYQGRLFVNLPGDGILIANVTDLAKPAGLHFARTLGYATHIAFSGDDTYVAAGYFGTSHIDLRAPAGIPKAP